MKKAKNSRNVVPRERPQWIFTYPGPPRRGSVLTGASRAEALNRSWTDNVKSFQMRRRDFGMNSSDELIFNSYRLNMYYRGGEPDAVSPRNPNIVLRRSTVQYWS